MAFLSVLKSDFTVFCRCMNNRLINGARIKNLGTSKKTTSFCRFYSDETVRIPKLISNKTVQLLKRKDRMSNDFNLIYRVPRWWSFTAMHIIISVTGIALPIVSYWIAAEHNFQFPINFGDNNVIPNKFFLISMICASSSILGMSFVLVRRFPFRIYHNSRTDDYVAVYGNVFFPLGTRKLKFKKGDTKMIEPSKYLPIQISNYKIKDQMSMLIEDHFLVPMHLHRMLNLEPRFDQF